MSLPNNKNFSINQVAKILESSPDTLRRLEKKGKIKPNRVSGIRQYSIDDITLIRQLVENKVSNKTLSIKEAADHLGVSIDTLRRWESAGKLVSQRTNGNHRRYTINELRHAKESIKKYASRVVNIPVQTPIQIIREEVRIVEPGIKVDDVPVLYSKLHIDQIRVFRSFVVLSLVVEIEKLLV